jgi:hypothetical protein
MQGSITYAAGTNQGEELEPTILTVLKTKNKGILERDTQHLLSLDGM